MAAEPFLVCRNVACGYHGRQVISNIDFAVARGEAVALLGPNGSGKSTLIKTISGLIRPISGQVTVDGVDLRTMKPGEVARQISVVPQDEPAPFSFTVRELVTLGRLAKSNGLFDTKEDREAADKAMEEAQCLELASRAITELSGGERQRVLIARALAQDCPLMLMDEPTAHLDAPHQVSTVRLVHRLTAAGATVVAAVHDLNIAALFASRAILLASGGILADASIQEILDSPLLDQAFQAQFDRVTTPSGRRIVVPRP